MIATIKPKPDDTATKPHIVAWTGQKSLIKVVTRTYCEEEIDASVGIYQLPDRALVIGMLCDKCSAAYRVYEGKLK